MSLEKLILTQIIKKLAALTQNPKVHHICSGLTMVPIYMNPVHTHPFLRLILILSHLSIPSASEWFPTFRDSYQNFACISFLSLMCHMIHSYILFDLLILIIVHNVTTAKQKNLPFSRVIKIHVKSLLPF